MRTIRDEDDSGAAFESVRVLRRSAKALLCEFDDQGQQWVPLSCLHDNSEIYVDEYNVLQGVDTGSGKLVLMSWFAKKEGLI